MTKPVPRPTVDTKAFWAACNTDQLEYQRCATCGRVQFYPRRFCANCQSADLKLSVSTGRGEIHSYTIVQKPANRSFEADVPFVVALVDLAEGFRIMTNIVGEDRLSAQIGAPVRIIFEARSQTQKIPQAMLDGAP